MTLMDFRVDQSNGMHFIYLIPFSETEALVESTLFTPEKLDDSFYRDTIKRYVEKIYNVSKFEIIEEESGVIPMGKLSQRDPLIPGLGVTEEPSVLEVDMHSFLFRSKYEKQFKELNKTNLFGLDHHIRKLTCGWIKSCS